MQDKFPSDVPKAEPAKPEATPAAATPPAAQAPAPFAKEPETTKVNVTPPPPPAEPPAPPPPPPSTPKPPAAPTAELPKIEVKVQEKEPEPLVTEMSEESPKEQWQLILGRITNFFNDPPDYLSEFFDKYKQPLTSVGLILAVFLSIKLLSGLLDSINDIPFIGPTFELIGLGYSAWFVYRYLLGARNREELSQLVTNLKEYVFGKDNQKS
ncbi:MAG TPA: CAAD domain-containing protein [Leptolyngbyaceae cyanobacterium]